MEYLLRCIYRCESVTNDGRKGKRAKGGHIGGDAPYGYRTEGAGKATMLVEDPVEQKVVKRIHDLHEQGKSLRAIAALLTKRGIFNRANKPFVAAQIMRILKRSERS